MVQIKNPVTIVKQSGGGYDESDPEQVYAHERPSDWMKMPDIGEAEDNIVYILLRANTITNQSIEYRPNIGSVGTLTGTIEIGSTDATGNFTAISELTQSLTNTPLIEIPASAFTQEDSEGLKQVIIKITATIPITSFRAFVDNSTNWTSGVKCIFEIKGKATRCTTASPSLTTDLTRLTKELMFWDFESGVLSSGSRLFRYCQNLRAVLSPIVVNGSCSECFSQCSNLKAIAGIETVTGITDVSSMFYNCGSLENAPSFDTSSATNFSSMFNSSSIINVPNLNYESATAINSLFTNTRIEEAELTELPNTITNFQNLFSGCSRLKKITIDFNHCSAPADSLCDGCKVLRETNIRNAENITRFYMAFRSCALLTRVPNLDLSSCTTIYGCFYSAFTTKAVDFRACNFSNVTANGFTDAFVGVAGYGTTIILGDTFGSNGLIATSRIFSGQNSSSDPSYIIIDKTDAMLSLATNATNVFGNDSYCFVCVPDALYEDYAADTYWATLGTRLKKISEFPGTLPA